MNDRTCTMVALKAFPFEGCDLRVGDPFMASPVDAEYLRRHRKAEHAPNAAAPAPAPAPMIPSLPDSAADAAAADTSQANDSPAASAAAGSEANAVPAPAPAPARKRASPRKKQGTA